ncbi:flavodoxin [Trichococcus ilyis]|uniref:Flavodoxin n=1 Tax=Trichococcus ilyis TaxID=640938 RepID=A0A143YN89_9LACT|nr:flavodoxin [Trichococcus ilyis]CZQ91529.1 flavodoxin signature [Trichococcus ilyis]SEI75445.1 Flavodoxin [Trichococcus ilyis]
MGKVGESHSFSADSSSGGSAGGKTAIVFYSLSGNTKKVAEEIRRQTGGDLFEIRTAEPYPQSYTRVTELVQEQRGSGTLPDVQPMPIRLGDYDTLFIGSPIWYGDSALPLQKWLEENSLAGKKVAAFFTSGGSSTAGAMADLRGRVKGAKMSEGLWILDARSKNVSRKVTDWLGRIR